MSEKGFKITYNPKRKDPWHTTFVGDNTTVSWFDFSDRSKPVLKCANCGVVHWEDRSTKREAQKEGRKD